MEKELENNCGFAAGWNEAKQRLADLKAELKKIIGVETEATFGLYKNGKLKLGYAKTLLVQQAFEKYGIDDPFGQATEK